MARSPGLSLQAFQGKRNFQAFCCVALKAMGHHFCHIQLMANKSENCPDSREGAIPSMIKSLQCSQTLSSLSVPLPERSSFFFTSWILGYFGGDHGELAEVFPGSLALVEFKSGRNSVGRPLFLSSSSSPWPLLLSHHHTQPLPQELFYGSLGVVWLPLACPCRRKDGTDVSLGNTSVSSPRLTTLSV